MFQDYDQFDMANEIDELDIFLKLSAKKENTETTNDTKTETPIGNGTVEENETNETEIIDEKIEDVAETTENNGTIDSEQAADVAA